MAMVRFGDVAERVNTKEDRFNTDLVYYVGGDHIESNALTVSGRGKIKEADLGPMFYFGFKPGDILFVTRNPHLRKSAKVDFAGICSEKTLVIATKDENVLLQDYLAGVMQSDDFWDFMEENKSGSVNYFINWSTLADYEFDLPPLDRQRKLAELLWAANDLKESYKKAITATDEMLKAKFREMFGDAGDDSSRGGAEARSMWPIVELQSACSTFIDGDWIEAKDQSEKGIRLVQTGNVGVGAFICKDDKSRWISEQTFTRLNCTEVFAGDILISRLPDPIGRACVLPHGLGKAITAVDCTIVRLKKTILPKFLIAVTDSASYRKQIEQATAGTTRARVSRGSLGRIRIPLPPLSLQREFVAIADKAESAKANLKKSIAAIDQVMKGLING